MNIKEPYDLAMYEESLKGLNYNSINKLLSNIVDDAHIKEILESTKGCLEILSSMTKEEKENASIINQNRQLRISRGSGKSINDIKLLLRRFERFKKMYAKMHS